VGATIQGAAAPKTYAYFSLIVGPPSPGGGSTGVVVAKTKFSGDSDTLGSLWYTGSTPPLPSTPSSSTVQSPPPPISSFRLTAGNFTWQSGFEGTLPLPIPRLTSAGCALGPGSPGCTLQLAVFCNSVFPCTYALSASTDSTTLTRLFNGIPSSGFVSPIPDSPSSAYARYSYLYSSASPANITLSAVASAGKTRVFVSQTWIPGSSLLESLPSSEDPSTFSLASSTDYTKPCPTCVTLRHPGGGTSAFVISVKGEQRCVFCARKRASELSHRKNRLVRRGSLTHTHTHAHAHTVALRRIK